MFKWTITLLLLLVTPYLLANEDGDINWRKLGEHGPFTLLIGEDDPCQDSITIFVNAESPFDFNRGEQGLLKLAGLARVAMSFECMGFIEIVLFGVSQDLTLYTGKVTKANNWQLKENYYLWESFYKEINSKNYSIQTLEQAAIFMKTTLGKMPHKNIVAKYPALAQELDKRISAERQHLNNVSSYVSSAIRDKKLASLIHLVEFLTAFDSANKSLTDAIFKELKQSVILTKPQIIARTIIADLSSFSAENDLSPKLVKKVEQVTVVALTEKYSQNKPTTIETINNRRLDIEAIQDNLTNVRFKKLSAWLENETEELATFEQQLVTKLQNELAQYKPKKLSEITRYFSKALSEADKLEKASYTKTANQLLMQINKDIDEFLRQELPKFKQKINQLEHTKENAKRLIDYRNTLIDLNNTYPRLNDYKEVVNNKFNNEKSKFCKAIVNESVSFFGGFSLNDQQTVKVTETKNFSLSKISCNLLEKGHVLDEFKRTTMFSRDFNFTVRLQDQNVETFTLVAVEDKSYNYEIAKNSDAENDIQVTFYQLVREPYSGEPNAYGVTHCDAFASDPFDNNKKGEGLNLESPADSETLNNALEACIAAVEFAPQNAQQNYQLARLLFYTGDTERAKVFNELPFKENYPPSMYLYGQSLFSDTDDENVFIDAVEIFRKSAKLGYQPAIEMSAEFEGMNLFKSIPAPTANQLKVAVNESLQKDVAKYNKKLDSMKGWGYTEMFKMDMTTKSISIKECFQVSANEFSCEYSVSSSCSSHAGGWIGMLAKANCPKNQQYFDNFKLENNRWRKLPSKF